MSFSMIAGQYFIQNTGMMPAFHCQSYVFLDNVVNTAAYMWDNTTEVIPLGGFLQTISIFAIVWREKSLQ